MALKFTESAQEHCLRSVGDPPNGIVGFSVSADIGLTPIVSAKADPRGPMIYDGQVPVMDERLGVTRLDDLATAVEACEGEREVEMLIRTAQTTVLAAAKDAILGLHPLRIARGLTGLEDLLEMTVER